MLLTVDVGNTETVIGIFQDNTLLITWRLSSVTRRTSDEMWMSLHGLCQSQHIDIKRISGIVISSVVPSLSTVFQEMAAKYWKINPIVISSDLETGIKIGYDIPQQVGADRICNAVAGFNLYGGPVIVVDLGTATTFDVISSDGVYLGGAIGLGMMGASRELHRLAAKLPRVDLAFPVSVVGTTTERSIQSGILWGTISMIDGMIEKITEEMQWPNVHVIATGGLADLILKYSKNIETVNTNLTLEGMKMIYHQMSAHQDRRNS